MTPPRDRLRLLLESTTLNGIDFVEVVAGSGQTALKVHFLKATPALMGLVTAATITGGDAIPSVTVFPISDADWSVDQSTVTLHVAAPGDFSLYTLTLTGSPSESPPPLDPQFDHVLFTFKAGCPSTLDCRRPPTVCANEPLPAPAIDYLAKDFSSFRQALLELSTVRYPSWQERSEADFGMMFLESLCSVADDLSYFQDRIAGEAGLDTATERRSIVRHARLVDYEPRPRTAARVILVFDVEGDPLIPAGVRVKMPDPGGGSIDFETGTGLFDTATYPAHKDWNGIQPHYWDDSERCLQAGSKEAWVLHTSHLLTKGQQLVIDTMPASAGGASIRELVTLAIDAELAYDPLIGTDTPPGLALWHLVWTSPLEHDHDLTRTTFAANVVPATQGRRFSERFTIEGEGLETVAVVRTGPNGSTQYLHTLDNAPLAWLPPPGNPSASPLPEVSVIQESFGLTYKWCFHRSLLDAKEFIRAFTVDPSRYVELSRRLPGAAVAAEYDGREGETIRFGDGIFGTVPNAGSVFQVTYRVGGGTVGNVAADTITQLEQVQLLTGTIVGVNNPLAASGGEDEESDERVRRRAPQAFRSKTFRAVRPEDYEAAAQTLPWVNRAAATSRYTGSWLTTFTAADTQGGEALTLAQHLEMIELIERRRLAGRESYVPEPRFVALDIGVLVCAKHDFFRGDVESAVRAALSAGRLPGGGTGFFHPDRLTFGRPLERSALEAWIQRVPGVDGIRVIGYRRRGVTASGLDMPQTITVAPDEILRVDSNPSRPERGSVLVQALGGK
jgi:Baseplate J-like protein